ncbi:MAG: hypothetical protein AABY15_08575 [Nanoarchaeota archaeon]
MKYTTENIILRGNIVYCIELDVADKNRPLQRHIWTENGVKEIEDWIPTDYDTHERLISKGYSVIKEGVK